MKRWNKKVAKRSVQKPSSTRATLPECKIAITDKTSTDNESNSSVKIKPENLDQVNSDTTGSNKTDSSSELSSIKPEKLEYCESSSGLSAEKNKKKLVQANTDSSSEVDSTADDSLYLCVELKLISIDQKCGDYKKLTHAFLCIGSDALVDHLKKLIVSKMTLSENCFEIVLMCNGFEVKAGCPLLFLKNKFFPKQEKLVLYYAIVERDSDSLSENELLGISPIDVK